MLLPNIVAKGNYINIYITSLQLGSTDGSDENVAFQKTDVDVSSHDSNPR